MPGDQIQQYTDPPRMSLVKQSAQIPVRTVTRRDLFIVPDIIASIPEWRIKAGIDPQRIASQIPDIIQPVDNALQIADPVSVRILKRLGIDFIKDSVF